MEREPDFWKLQLISFFWFRHPLRQALHARLRARYGGMRPFGFNVVAIDGISRFRRNPKEHKNLFAMRLPLSPRKP